MQRKMNARAATFYDFIQFLFLCELKHEFSDPLKPIFLDVICPCINNFFY